MAKDLESFIAELSPAQLRAQEYYRQIKPIEDEDAVQMISTSLSGDVETAKEAVFAKLMQSVEIGTIDAEMAEIAKDEFGLRGIEERI